MNNRTQFWHKLESGQALSEYWPTIPAAIMITIAAGAMAWWLQGSFMRTAEGLNRAGLPEEICETTEETTSGPTVAQLGDHQVEVSAVKYDPDTDTTTVSYTVTSGAQPSISHWVLSLPPEVVADLIEASEGYEWTDADPTTGTAGIKFDTGYEGGDAGGPADKEEKGGGKGKGKASAIDVNNQYVSAGFDMMGDFGYTPGTDTVQQTGESTTYEITPTGETRDIVLVFSGQYTFSTTTVSVKAGTETEYAEISAPMEAVEEETSSAENLTADSFHKGCE